MMTRCYFFASTTSYTQAVLNAVTMDTNFTMEVLMLTNTKFSKREYVQSSEPQLRPQPQQNKLAEACWNGLVPVMLPELFESINSKDVMMWQLEEGSECLYMQIGNQPSTPEPDYGLHPWLLFANAWQN